jgi:hypothetical protein
MIENPFDGEIGAEPEEAEGVAAGEPAAIRIRRLDKKETTGDFSNSQGN